MKYVDPFDLVHDMLRSKNYVSAISTILNYDTGRIRPPYNKDLNHAWYIVGDAYFKLGDYEQSLRAFKSSLRNRADDCEAIMAVANCYSESGKPKKAKDYLLKAIKLGKDCAVPVQVLAYNLGNAYYDMKKYELAIIEYEKITGENAELYEMAMDNLKRARVELEKKEKQGTPVK